MPSDRSASSSPSDSPCMNNLNGRPVSLHVRGGERSGDNTRSTQKSDHGVAFVGR